jgi:ferrous iron transport protein B
MTIINFPTNLQSEVRSNQPRFSLNYGPEIETEICRLIALMKEQLAPAPAGNWRWLAVKLLEGEANIIARVEALNGGSMVMSQVEESRNRISRTYGDEADIAIADARYGYINGLARQVLDTSQVDRYTLTDRIDRLVTNRVLGLPIFLLVMYVIFKLVVEVSTPFTAWIDFTISGPISRWVSNLLIFAGAPAWLQSLIIDGVIAGVGSVLVFLPSLFVLYFFLTLLEDSGYMARAAFVMDKVMSFLGLHGKSFIPLILGFGCAVPAIYATRTLESRRDRLATGLLIPLMSCSARLPVYVVFGLAFFPAHADGLITSMYALGLIVAGLAGWVFTRTIFRNSGEAAFVLELPPYRLPAWRGLLIHTWEKSKEFIHKAGTVILTVSILLWFLMNLPWGVAHQRDSYFGQASAAMAPLFKPAGFDQWQAAGALVAGSVAKEVVVSTLAQIYIGDETATNLTATTLGQDVGQIMWGFGQATVDSGKTVLSLIPGINLIEPEEASEDTALSAALHSAFTPLAALAFVVFVLIYTPCVATLSAIRAEYGWRWVWFSAFYQSALAWLMAVLVYQGGQFLGWG